MTCLVSNGLNVDTTMLKLYKKTRDTLNINTVWRSN